MTGQINFVDTSVPSQRSYLLSNESMGGRSIPPHTLSFPKACHSKILASKWALIFVSGDEGFFWSFSEKLNAIGSPHASVFVTLNDGCLSGLLMTHA